MLLGLILKPLGALLIFGCIALPIRYLLWKLPEGKLRTFLLTERFKSTISGSGRYLLADT